MPDQMDTTESSKTPVEEATPDDTVRVHVFDGNVGVILTISKKLAKTHGGKFADQFHKKTAAETERTAVLVDFNTETIADFIIWLDYQAAIDKMKAGGEAAHSPKIKDWVALGPLWHRSHTEMKKISISLFVLAHRYGIPQLCIDATDRLVWCAYHRRASMREMQYSARDIEFAYRHTDADSPLRKILVDSFWIHLDKGYGLFSEDISDYPKEFLTDLVVRYADENDYHDVDGFYQLSTDIFEGWEVHERCAYHDHEFLVRRPGGKMPGKCDLSRIKINYPHPRRRLQPLKGRKPVLEAAKAMEEEEEEEEEI